MNAKKFLLVMFLCVLNGCATTPSTSIFGTMNGRFLALPEGVISAEHARALSNEYKAVTRFTPARGISARVTQNALNDSFGPSRYRRGIVADVDAMMQSAYSWEILIIPENSDFMVSVLKLIPTRNPGLVKINLLAPMTPRLEHELKRLYFISQ